MPSLCTNQEDQTLISPSLAMEELELEKPVKLGIMASGSGTNFDAVAQAIADGKLNAKIPILIYNNPDAKVVSKAEKWQVPTLLLNHRDYTSREDLDRAIVGIMASRGVELIVMAGWMRVVTQVLFDAFPHRVINIHPSLLPSFKGLKAIEQALAAKVTVTGCTVHIACLEVDSGPILIQAAVPVLDGDTPETLHRRIQIQEHRILPQGVAIAAKKLRGK